MPSYSIEINDTRPIWFYCSQGRHCQQGMVGVINAYVFPTPISIKADHLMREVTVLLTILPAPLNPTRRLPPEHPRTSRQVRPVGQAQAHLVDPVIALLLLPVPEVAARPVSRQEPPRTPPPQPGLHHPWSGSMVSEVFEWMAVDRWSVQRQLLDLLLWL